MIDKISITNFKAIEHSLNLPLQPFTAFIGNNGSGKSSIMEALRTLHLCLTTNMQEAFAIWGGLDKVRNYHALQEEATISDYGFKQRHKPITFQLQCRVDNKAYQYILSLNLSLNSDNYVVENEELHCDGKPLLIGNAIDNQGNSLCHLYTSAYEQKEYTYKSNTLLLALRDANPFILHDDVRAFQTYILNWQFLYLNAHDMGKPVMQNRLTKNIRLDYDGRNIAEYILWIRSQGQEYLDSIVRKMVFVLPYIKQIQPNIQETFNREVELLLHETHNKSTPLPGWLLSSGTLRILALLSVFDSPQRPSILFVDEIENGLDPRTIGLIMSEIESVFNEQSMQVLLTTHSPYLLDLVPLENIILTDKTDGKCIFSLAKDIEGIEVWRKKFTPGSLYSMGKFSKS